MEQHKQPPEVKGYTLRPTKKQQELLGFIGSFISEHGYSPSYREIMSGVGYTSVATVALHVNNLIARGHLVKRGRSARSIEVVGASIPVQPELATNYVRPADEKWLVDRIELAFVRVEQNPSFTAADLDGLTVLLAALRVLDLEQAAQSFQNRLHALRVHLSDG